MSINFLNLIGLDYFKEKIVSLIPTKVSQLTNDSKYVTDSDSRLSNSRTPTAHASTATTYGVGTTSSYGHVKTINNLTTSSHTNGNALSAYQGYVLEQGKVDKVTGKGLSTKDFTADYETKLKGIAEGAQVNTITGVKGDNESSYRIGNINITKSNIGLGNVENKSSATIRGELTKANVTTALGYTPPSSDTNTTYSLTQDATDGHKITLTPSSGSATTITIPDNNTTYSAGTGISFSGTTINNSGVRSVSTGSTNGTISVNTGGTSAEVSVKGLGDLAYKSSLSKSDIGLGNVENKSSSTIRGELTKSNVTTALGYTPPTSTEMENSIETAIENAIEITSNDNGTAIKYANGRMIQYGNVTAQSGSSSTSIGRNKCL